MESYRILLQTIVAVLNVVKALSYGRNIKFGFSKGKFVRCLPEPDHRGVIGEQAPVALANNRYRP